MSKPDTVANWKLTEADSYVIPKDTLEGHILGLRRDMQKARELFREQQKIVDQWPERSLLFHERQSKIILNLAHAIDKIDRTVKRCREYHRLRVERYNKDRAERIAYRAAVVRDVPVIDKGAEAARKMLNEAYKV